MKAKVLEISEATKITTSYGDYYKFNLVLDNNDKGNTTLLKTATPPCSIGEEIEYEREEKNGYKSIKLTSKNKQFGGGQAKRDYVKDGVGFAMSYAKDLVVAGVVKLEDLTTQADTIYDRMKTKYGSNA